MNFGFFENYKTIDRPKMISTRNIINLSSNEEEVQGDKRFQDFFLEDSSITSRRDDDTIDASSSSI